MRTWSHKSGLVALAVTAILSFSIAAPANTIPPATTVDQAFRELTGYLNDD